MEGLRVSFLSGAPLCHAGNFTLLVVGISTLLLHSIKHCMCSVQIAAYDRGLVTANLELWLRSGFICRGICGFNGDWQRSYHSLVGACCRSYAQYCPADLCAIDWLKEK